MFPFVAEQKNEPLVIDENWTLKFCSMNQSWIYNEVDISYIFTRKKNKRILAKLINISPKITIIVSFRDSYYLICSIILLYNDLEKYFN